MWTDVHNSLIAAIGDAIVPEVAPDYYVGLERRAYLLKPDDIVFVGRADLAIITDKSPVTTPATSSFNGVMTVEVPMTDEIGEDYLEIHEVKSGKLITLIEVLSPTNKISREGREQYMQKRSQILPARTNLIEIDLLRSGEPMPVVGRTVSTDYRTLISRGHQRPKAQLYGFGVRRSILEFPLPTLPHETEPQVDLNTILHDLYIRARFDLRLDYSQQPLPPLAEDDAAWAQALIRGH